jgi:putative hydrolase of the HAD superfamily
VLFDAAGTLIETREPVGRTYARVARDYGVAISAWRLGDAFTRVLAQMPPLVFPGAGAPEIDALERGWWRETVRRTFRAADSAARLSDPEACFERLYGAYAGPEAWRARPGALEALRDLRAAGLATAVVSNFDRRLRAILAGLALAAQLDAVVLPSDVGAAKPDPAIFAEALARLGVDAADAVYIGDDPSRDHDGARRAGLRVIDVGGLATLAELPPLLLSPTDANQATEETAR